MSTPSWLLIVAMLAPILGASGVSAADKPLSFQERWKLEFFPEDLPDQRPLLSRTAWVKAGDMNILGRQADLVIRFPEHAGDRTELIPFSRPEPNTENGINSVLQPVEFTHIFYPGLPANEPITETTEKYHRSLLVGPCLEYGGRVRTLHVVKDKQLLLNAVVPVNILQWYTVQVDFTDRDPIGRPKPDRPTRVTEFLYEFGADPLTVDEGPLTIHYHSRDSREEKTTIAHFHRTFRKETPPKYIPGVRRISTGLTPLLFYPEFNVAVTDENPRDLFESEELQPLTKKIEESLSAP